MVLVAQSFEGGCLNAVEANAYRTVRAEDHADAQDLQLYLILLGIGKYFHPIKLHSCLWH